MMAQDPLEVGHQLTRDGQAFALATVVRAEKPTSAKPGAKAIVTPDGTLTGWVGGSCAQPTVIREALKALQDGEPRFIRLCPPQSSSHSPQEGVIEITLTCASGGTLDIYIEPRLPRPSLVVVGHLPVAEALAELGKGLNFDVTVMALETTADRFPRADHFFDKLDFSQIAIGRQTYIVVASHGNYDEEALEGALMTGAPYVALVASKKRAATVVDYLRGSGVPDDRVAQLKYPAGLDLGAIEPEEIALSILAEIVQVRHREQPAPLNAPPADDAVAAEAIDPVCGMTVEIPMAQHRYAHEGHVYYFCCAGCRRSFEQEPSKYLQKQGS